jgi:AcrR family transcriptional regulator
MKKPARRADALSKERIVEAAIAILDAEGEAALTFRTLAARLSTGPGAIYWHVANKDDLLAAAADDVIARVTGPGNGLRAVALGIFDAIDAHPWVGAQLTHASWQVGVVRIFEAIGRELPALGVPEARLFAVASALVACILGVASQHAAAARAPAPLADRTAFLADVAARWQAFDRATFPFVHRMAPQLADHDDREQFLEAIDLILAGIRQA